MSRMTRRVLLLCTVVGALCSVSVPLSAAETASPLTAEQAVEGYIGTLLQEMEGIKPLYQSDRPAYFAAVEAALDEFVDFREVARGVMARYGTGPNGATEEQLLRFSDVFRESLVDFYGSALANYGGVDFEILPMDAPSEDPDNNSNVRMSIKADDGSRFEVQYVMFLNQDRIWKLKNLYVEGVNLRRQYYAQFDSLMTSNDFDIDKVIDGWMVTQ
jgi:phospholipid transport system substrate-binding protein